MRCYALATAWQRTGGTVSWFLAEAPSALEERLEREGVQVSHRDTAPGSQEDAELLIAAAGRCDAAWTVVDGYRFTPAYVRRLKDAGLKILCLDDDARFEFYAADIVLNQNISATPGRYEKREKATQLLLGPQFVLLRPEFLAERPDRTHPKVGRKVLVTMGGSDPENVTAKVLRAIRRLRDECEARVVVGEGNPWKEELRLLAGSMRPQVQVEFSPPNMAPLMAWADVAISGAGSTCWELAYMGLPAILIALSDDQRGVADGIAQNQVGISLGWHANVSEDTIADALQSLLHDPARRADLGERGQKLVDGRGAERVVDFLQKQI